MLKLITEWTIEEKTTLIEAICYRFNYSDTKTLRTEIVTPTENLEWVMEDIITYKDEVVPNDDPNVFATKKIAEILDWFVKDYSIIKAQKVLQDKQDLLDEEIKLEADKNILDIG